RTFESCLRARDRAGVRESGARHGTQSVDERERGQGVRARAPHHRERARAVERVGRGRRRRRLARDPRSTYEMTLPEGGGREVARRGLSSCHKSPSERTRGAPNWPFLTGEARDRRCFCGRIDWHVHRNVRDMRLSIVVERSLGVARLAMVAIAAYLQA